MVTGFSTWKDRKPYQPTADQLAEWEGLYQRHFERLNHLYFENTLPPYRIRVQDPLVVPGVPADLCKYMAGYCDKRRRQIWLEAFPFPKGEGILLHEMAHAATNAHHGPRFRREMTRLAGMAAPLSRVNLAAYVTV